MYFPSLGAFEIYFNGILVFSKYESERWPEPMEIVGLLKDIDNEFNKEGNLKKYEIFRVMESNIELKTVESQERNIRL